MAYRVQRCCDSTERVCKSPSPFFIFLFVLQPWITADEVVEATQTAIAANTGPDGRPATIQTVYLRHIREVRPCRQLLSKIASMSLSYLRICRTAWCCSAAAILSA